MNKELLDKVKVKLKNHYATEMMNKVLFKVLLKFIYEEDNYNGNYIEKYGTEYKEFILGEGLKYRFNVRKFEDKFYYIYSIGVTSLSDNEFDEDLVGIELYKNSDNGFSYDSSIVNINDEYRDILSDIYNIDFVKGGI